ncbi:putative AsmA family protein [uncultured Desulfatiglans sp.]|uniref:Putative AsmA family protein n=1 Tax=Uncultured Desulfatiglans sp. TaxID=1748965 RepID=A0A653AIB5_UNCDX|nr:putative AsmA family protein [uncultured Desulfatiglans sp.]
MNQISAQALTGNREGLQGGAGKGGGSMRWKWLLGIFAALIVLLVVAVYIFAATYDYDRLRPRIVQAVKKSTGRDLLIEKPLAVEVGFSPVIVLEEVRFGDFGEDSEAGLLRVKRCEIQIALLPLLKDVLEVKRLQLVEPQFHVDRSSPPGPRAPGGAGPGTGSDSGPVSTTEEGAGQPARSDGAVERGAQRFPAFGFKDVEVVDGVVVYRSGPEGAVHTLRLERFEARSGGMDANIDLEASGDYEGHRFELKGRTGGLPALTDPKRPWDVRLEGLFGGAAISIEGEMEDVFHIRGGRFTVSFHGEALESLPFVGSPGMTGWPGPFEGRFEIGDVAEGRYRISGLHMRLAENTLEGELELDTNGPIPSIEGALSSERLDLRPFISKREADASKPGAGASGSRDAAGGGRVFSSEAIRIPIPSWLILDLNCAFKNVFMPKWAFTYLGAQVQLSDGRLRIEDLKADTEAGSVTGRFHFKAAERGIVLDALCKVTKLDVSRMLKKLGEKPSLEGELDADLDLQGQGASFAEIMAGLDGKVSLVMGAGRIDSSGVDFWGADVVQSLMQVVDPARRPRSTTDFNCLVAGFLVTGGLARSTALVLDTDVTSLVGEGQVNLRYETLDLEFALIPKSGLSVPGLGKVGITIGQLTRPFKVGGTLKKPAVRFDVHETAWVVGKAVGGSLLFGPAGIAAALATGAAGSENPCLAAVRAAEAGVPVREDAGTPKELIDGMVDQAGKLLDRLLGR